MTKSKKTLPKTDNRAAVNLLLSNQENKRLLQELLQQQGYEVISDSVEFTGCHLIILDGKHLKDNIQEIAELKEDEFAFAPVIYLQEAGSRPVWSFEAEGEHSRSSKRGGAGNEPSWSSKMEGNPSESLKLESESSLTSNRESSPWNIIELVEDVIELPISKNFLLARVTNLIRSKKLWDSNKVLKDRYESIFNNINDMVFLLDNQEGRNSAGGGSSFKISEVNERLRGMLKYRQGALKGSSPENFMPEEDIKRLVEIIKDYGEAIFMTEFQTSKGAVFPVEINARRVQIYHRTQLLCAARDITEKKEREEKIKYLLFHDELTDLYNRRFFEEEVKRLDTERQLPVSIFVIDINGMKLVNDSYGHKSGDKLLNKAADLLKSTFREEDILARWGGDEFSVFLPQTSEAEAEKILKRIKDKCEETAEHKLPVSLGVGYAVKEDRGQDIFEVFNLADREMYQDKLTAQNSAASKMVQSLLSSLAAKSPETEAHTRRLKELAIRLGKKLGLSNNQLNNLSLLAALHDIGKINISEEIINKPGKLTWNEWEKVKEHSRTGYKIALSSEEFSAVAEEILAHHERWDGAGYPYGLEKDEIPLLSRIIGVVDAYDVMVNGSPYQEALSQAEALKELKDCAGSQFDPELVEEFVDLLKDS